MARAGVNDAKHWRDRAAEMRILSTTLEHGETQAIMIRLAEDYDKMADRAEYRIANTELTKQTVLK